ncbi:hypothetical protein NX059_003351 [Plenodomus lindquistii]|nr:hypothetical protein NX059_003351 [Plenodomus lindquistii]
MKALKLSSNPDEKRELKAQCGEIMTVADRIKNSTSWTPSAQPSTGAKNTRIDQWAEDVAGSKDVTTATEDVVSHSSSSHHGLSSTTTPVENVRALPGKSSASSVSANLWDDSFGSSPLPSHQDHSPFLLIDLSEDITPSSPMYTQNAPANLSDEVTSRVGAESKTNLNASGDLGAKSATIPRSPAIQVQPIVAKSKAPTPTPAVAPHSQIHRLAEPVSSRKRSKREDIILLKASVVNGFKCPPWDRTPASDEFLAKEAGELFL